MSLCMSIEHGNPGATGRGTPRPVLANRAEAQVSEYRDLWHPNRSRREFLYGLGASLGSVALTAMLARDACASAAAITRKIAHASARAKNCIFLMMEGGPS